MSIKEVLKQAEDFDFDIYRNATLREYNKFVYDDVDYSVQSLFDCENYAFQSEEYIDSDDSFYYTVSGNIGGHFKEYNNLSEDEVIPTLKKMVAARLAFEHADSMTSVTGNTEVPEDNQLSANISIEKGDNHINEDKTYIFAVKSDICVFNEYELFGASVRFDEAINIAKKVWQAQSQEDIKAIREVADANDKNDLRWTGLLIERLPLGFSDDFKVMLDKENQIKVVR